MIEMLGGLLAGILLGLAGRPLLDAYLLHVWARELDAKTSDAMTPGPWSVRELLEPVEESRRDTHGAARG